MFVVKNSEGEFLERVAEAADSYNNCPEVLVPGCGATIFDTESDAYEAIINTLQYAIKYPGELGAIEGFIVTEVEINEV